jgi:hypothetical protein
MRLDETAIVIPRAFSRKTGFHFFAALVAADRGFPAVELSAFAGAKTLIAQACPRAMRRPPRAGSQK